MRSECRKWNGNGRDNGAGEHILGSNIVFVLNILYSFTRSLNVSMSSISVAVWNLIEFNSIAHSIIIKSADALL
jgi:hypothetical protein